MKLMDFIVPDAIEADMKSRTKVDAIRELVALLKRANAIDDEKDIADVVLEREELGTTGIGEGIAVPHGKSSKVDRVLAAFGRSKKGVDFGSVDNKPVHLMFLIVAPVGSSGPHLLALARVSRLLKNKQFRENLMKAKDNDEILKILKSENDVT